MVTDKVEDEAKRCVILAIKVPTVINFEEVLALDAIKYLQSVIYIKFLISCYRKTKTSLTL